MLFNEEKRIQSQLARFRDIMYEWSSQARQKLPQLRDFTVHDRT